MNDHNSIARSDVLLHWHLVHADIMIQWKEGMRKLRYRTPPGTGSASASGDPTTTASASLSVTAVPLCYEWWSQTITAVVLNTVPRGPIAPQYNWQALTGTAASAGCTNLPVNGTGSTNLPLAVNSDAANANATATATSSGTGTGSETRRRSAGVPVAVTTTLSLILDVEELGIPPSALTPLDFTAFQRQSFLEHQLYSWALLICQRTDRSCH